MNLVDIIVIAILAVLVGLAIAFIIRAKKRGQKCIGCPYSGQCGSTKNNKKCTNNCNTCNKYDDDCYKIKVDI